MLRRLAKDVLVLSRQSLWIRYLNVIEVAYRHVRRGGPWYSSHWKTRRTTDGMYKFIVIVRHNPDLLKQLV